MQRTRARRGARTANESDAWDPWPRAARDGDRDYVVRRIPNRKPSPRVLEGPRPSSEPLALPDHRALAERGPATPRADRIRASLSDDAGEADQRQQPGLACSRDVVRRVWGEPLDGPEGASQGAGAGVVGARGAL